MNWIKRIGVLGGCIALTMVMAACTAEKTVEVPKTENKVVKEEVVAPIEEIQGLEDYKGLIKVVQKDQSLEQPENEQLKQLEKAKKQIAGGMALPDLLNTFEAQVVTLSPQHADELADLTIAELQKKLMVQSAKMEKRAVQPGYMKDFYKESERVKKQYGRLILDTEAIQDPDVKKEAIEAKKNGYALSTSEGMIYYVVDYTRFARYQAFYTEDFATLMLSMAYDTIEPLFSDGAIRVSRENLAARAALLEQGLRVKEKTDYRDYVVARYLNHLDSLIYGSNNSPTFDYETNRVLEEQVTFLNKQLEQDGQIQSDSQTNRILRAYVGILEKNKGVVNDSVRKEVTALLEGLQKEFGVSSKDLERYASWESGIR